MSALLRRLARTTRVRLWFPGRSTASTALLFTIVLSTACSAPTPEPTPPPAAQAPDEADAAASLTFVNRVWRVAESSAGPPGQLYVFLSEGTLVMASATTTATLGTWRREGAGLIMVEEGIPYPVDIVSLSGAEFRIRSHNPGTPVDLRLVPATGDEP